MPGSKVPESKLPSSAVTVWGALVGFVHVTIVPFLIVVTLVLDTESTNINPDESVAVGLPRAIDTIWTAPPVGGGAVVVAGFVGAVVDGVGGATTGLLGGGDPAPTDGDPAPTDGDPLGGGDPAPTDGDPAPTDGDPLGGGPVVVEVGLPCGLGPVILVPPPPNDIVKLQPLGAAALRKNMAVATSSKVHLTDDSRQRSFENTFRRRFRNTFIRRTSLK
ncbi:MAG TPA: hypothetical protein VGL94_00795 [Ktedonobacteraceae bacterium]